MLRNRSIVSSLLLLWCCGLSKGSLCSTLSPKTLQFSIKSSFNITGHWIAQVQLQHGVEHKDRSWEVDVDHSTIKCENAENVLILATITAPPRRPEPNYELVPGLGYYKLHNTTRKWQDAQQICTQEGSHLLILNSDEEFEAIKISHNYLWTGINDIRRYDNFVTIFNQSLNSTGYNKWHSTEPSHNGNCVVVDKNGFLHDTGCTNGFPFVCEQEI